MSYYDNVKDNVQDKKNGASNKPSFDTLKEEAEKTSVDEDEDNSNEDTPIEVLEEGGLRKQQSSQQNSQQQSSQHNTGSQPQQNSSKDPAPPSQDVDMSSIEEKLDKMIKQNQRIIEVLESFGQ